MFAQSDFYTRNWITSPHAIFRWDPIIYFYTIYIGTLLVGGLLGRSISIYGAAIFLTLLYGHYWIYLSRIKFDVLTYCILLCLLIPLIPLINYDHQTLVETAQELTKYLALHLVILLGFSLPLTPLSRAKKRWIAYCAILLFLTTGCLWNIAQGQIAIRIKGFLPNPNVFALTAIMLLFLTNIEKPRTLLRYFSYVVVIFLVLISKTSGALLGLIAGFSHHIFLSKPHNRFIHIMMLILTMAIAISLFFILPKGTISAVDTTLAKLEITAENLDRALSGKSIDFYDIIERKGSDLTSGLWRIYQWTKIMTLFFNSSIDKILFGYGIGTTDVLFKLKSHNDYIRILFETGIVGLIFNMTVWIILYRRMELKYRWVVIIFAVFCLTENNYDHFPAMSLLAFYMLSTARASVVIDQTRISG
jgi:hypothetical protein